jgi:hypothetical protein
MSNVWLVVDVEDSTLPDKPLGDGIKLRYAVDTVSLRVFEESRDLGAILKSADEGGFELVHANDISRGVPPWVWDKVEFAMLGELRKKLGLNVRSFAVSIRPVARITKY